MTEGPPSAVPSTRADPPHRYPMQDGLTVAMRLLYIWWWSVRAKVRSLLEENAKTVLVVSLVLLLVEILLELFAVQTVREASGVLRGFLGAVFVVVLYSKVREFRDREREFTFTEVCREVVEAVGPSSRGRSFREQVLQILGSSRAIFKDTVVFVWVEEEDNVLKIDHRFPLDAPCDESLRLPRGKGGAGLCCQTNEVVYFPKTSIRHGVTQDFRNAARFSVVPDLYVPTIVEYHESVLCVPVLSSGECYGVLSFCSRKSNHFGRLDFSRAAFFGFALAETFRHNGRTFHQDQ